ncbi:hypothetical protein LTR53_001388 [Teratosphaeriaceae sp. CCFEE 6253]|nr:hypothetical protein LTR53_001388 [Teratosphaeriaceae sp. CCFEE 6253]
MATAVILRRRRFRPLKRALAGEIDRVSRFDSGRVSRAEWTEIYIRAREAANSTSKIVSGWHAVGLEPFSPITVLNKLDQTSTLGTSSEPRRPRRSLSLDTSLPHSSPPEGTELREANAVFIHEIEKAESVASPVKRYVKRLTRNSKAAQCDNVTLRKELAEPQELLRSRRTRKTERE